ncbi:MAG: hypothetical protein MZV63_35935 [Marinilabiliales bacterium]|nr:hypothetical protein [Marinilabiliales bacterium]
MPTAPGLTSSSSSLGYFTFDDPSMDYSFSDMDGNTAFITRAADIAASKGILVVNSAGNERNKEWVRIIAPVRRRQRAGRGRSATGPRPSPTSHLQASHLTDR